MGTNVKLKGGDVALFGDPPNMGDSLPESELTNDSLESVALSSFQGKTLLLMSVPSLDTPVCSLESKRFNDEVGKLGGNLQAVVVSMDLPFAQKRWCCAEGVENLTLLSDYRLHDFGQQLGLLIPKIGLLARAVFVVDSNGKVTYRELVHEVTDEPNYDAVLNHLKDL